MSDLTVRRYEPDDAEAVWDLHERALRDIGAYDEAYAHLDADLRAVESAYLDAGGEFLVGEIDGTDGSGSEIVAMGALQPSAEVDHHETDPAAAVVRRMRVDPAHQRRGFGSRTLRELEARAKELGFDRLVLDTTPDQESAVALYESFGYAETRRESTPAGEMIFYEREL
ncbi:GNAT family N-acetyltransferase [Halosimplex halophilum]|uniref:GNAT family N-acetyltransferase n=1 Tax=Halosimplex halophilum TaxID=2559572 RepID=UPI00107FA158|nr:GNAT family N-acetyltransferase [Halosimplex halophilum]